MNRISIFLISFYLFTACTSNSQDNSETKSSHYSLEDYFTSSTALDSLTDATYARLTEEQRISQLIITSAGELGKPTPQVVDLVARGKVGGVLFLKGSKSGNTALTDSLQKIAKANGNLPLLFSIDAEPSLYNRRVTGSSLKVKNTIEIKDAQESAAIARAISGEITEMGFHQNYAPVIDLSTSNEAITHRSYGVNRDTVVAKALSFVSATQKTGIVSTVKHFPGHGFVKGDTHKEPVYIDGDLKEIDMYPPFIEAGVLSVMVAHVAVKNNAKYGTGGKPATLSRNIVTDLLRDSLGFKGIIVTDAMNMMAAASQGESAPFLAVKAGCDMILMPPNEAMLLKELMRAQKTNHALKQQIVNSVKRVIRLKLCLGLF